MNTPILLTASDCDDILGHIRSKVPKGSIIIINLAIAQGQEDVFALQTIRNVNPQEAVVIMLDSAKAYIENSVLHTNPNPPETQ